MVIYSLFLLHKWGIKIVKYRCYIVDGPNFYKTNYEIFLRNCKLPILDLILIKKGNNIVTTVYHKATTNDIYLNWKSFAPDSWKRGTLKTLVDRLCLICSNITLRKKEIDHLKKVFYKKNDHPKWVISQFLNEVEEKHKTSVNNVSEEPQVSRVTDLKRHLLVLPYQVQKGDFIIKSIKKRLKTLLVDNVKTNVAFQAKQLSSWFNIKNKTKFTHKHDLIYHAKCAEESYNDNYVSETARHNSERMLDHSERDKNSHILKQ